MLEMERVGKKQKLESDNLKVTRLSNGMACYLYKNDLRPNCGTLSLVIKAGSLCEEPYQAGVAHLLEHLLVRAGAEIIGSPFLSRLPVHEHHETTPSHTLFTIQVKGKDEILEAINLYSLIVSQKVVIKDCHIEAESNIIAMEYKEYMDNKLTHAADSFHSLFFEYASSAEKSLDNLKNINSVIVNEFYKKWYISSHMALLITGNVEIEDLLAIAQQSFCGETVMTAPTVPRSQSWTSELSVMNDSISSNALVFKLERSTLLENWGRTIMVNASSKRLEQSCKGIVYLVERGLNMFIVVSSSTSVQKLVYEFLRLIESGLSTLEIERELTSIRKETTQEPYLFHLDKYHQIKVLQRKFANHFLYGDEINTPDSEVNLCEYGNLPDLARQSLKLLEIARARIYLRKPFFRRFGSSERLLEEVRKKPLVPWIDTRTLVNFDEHWKCEDQVPQSVRHLEKIGMLELELSNGMLVLLCRSEYPYECSIKGFAYGGLSQQDEMNYVSSYFALDLVDKLPSFALKHDLVGRENLKIKLDVQDYIRSFESLFDKPELTVALQLVYLLFCEKPNPAPADIQKVCNSLEDKAIRSHRVYEYVTEQSLPHKLPTSEDIAQVNARKALDFFSQCFQDPSQFSVVIVGDFDVEETAKLVQKYLGSIPRSACDTFPPGRSGLKTFPINFVEGGVKHEIDHDQSFEEVYICLPLKMEKEKQDEDEVLIENLEILVTERMKTFLRSEMGEVYDVSANALFDGKLYASPGSEEAILLVNFCYTSQGLMNWNLTDEALKELENFQNALSEEDLAYLPLYLEPDKVWCSSVLKEVVYAYQAKQYNGDLEKTILERRKMLREISTSQDIIFWKKVFERVMPYKCTERYVCVAFHDAGSKQEKDIIDYSDDDESDDYYDKDGSESSDDDSDEDGFDDDSDE